MVINDGNVFYSCKRVCVFLPFFLLLLERLLRKGFQRFFVLLFFIYVNSSRFIPDLTLLVFSETEVIHHLPQF